MRRSVHEHDWLRRHVHRRHGLNVRGSVDTSVVKVLYDAFGAVSNAVYTTSYAVCYTRCRLKDVYPVEDFKALRRLFDPEDRCGNDLINALF